MFLSKVQFFLYVICLFDICLHLLEINVSQWKKSFWKVCGEMRIVSCVKGKKIVCLNCKWVEN